MNGGEPEPPVADALLRVLNKTFTPSTSRLIIRWAAAQAGRSPRALESGRVDRKFIGYLERAVRLHAKDQVRAARCIEALERLLEGPRVLPAAVVVPIINEEDILRARNQGRLMAAALGFDETARMKIATAISELARNIFRYASTGRVALSAVDKPSIGLRILAEDNGPGIANLDGVLAGRYRSKTGMGLGLLGVKRLMDSFEIETSSASGTRVVACLHLRT